jgi:polyisoprenoid-binding protein YceI
MIRNRSAVAAALAFVLPLTATAASQSAGDIPRGHFELDKRHASLIARVQHMGVSLYTVRFDTLDADFDYDPEHPEATHVTASVDPASLDVNADYSKTFAEEFLQASKFPKATFVSTSIQPGPGGAQGVMTGDLTLMGVTKPVSFNVTLIGTGHEPLPLPLGQRAAGFEATATIKRSDFGSTFLNNLVGDEVTLQIEAEFDHK